MLRKIIFFQSMCLYEIIIWNIMIIELIAYHGFAFQYKFCQRGEFSALVQLIMIPEECTVSFDF